MRKLSFLVIMAMLLSVVSIGCKPKEEGTTNGTDVTVDTDPDTDTDADTDTNTTTP